MGMKKEIKILTGLLLILMIITLVSPKYMDIYNLTFLMPLAHAFKKVVLEFSADSMSLMITRYLCDEASQIEFDK